MYHKFLQDFCICNLDDLTYVLVEERCMKLSKIDGNIIQFLFTDFCDCNDNIVKLFHNSLFYNEGGVKKPLFLDTFVENLTVNDIFGFSLDMSEYSVFAIESAVRFIVFWCNNQWNILLSDNGTINATNATHATNATELFTETCEQNRIDIDKMLQKKFTYVFYVQHRDLNPLYTQFRSRLYLFQVYDIESFCYNDSLVKMDGFDRLTVNMIPTKYDLHQICSNIYDATICDFLIEMPDKKQCRISNWLYKSVLKFSEFKADKFKLFLRIKQTTLEMDANQSQQILQFFGLQLLDKTFAEMVSVMYQNYLSIYANGVSHYSEDVLSPLFPIMHKQQILCQIHYFHLQIDKKMYVNDIKNMFLFIFDEKITLDLLRDFFKLHLDY